MAARFLSRFAIVLMIAALAPVACSFAPGLRDIDLSKYGPAPAWWMLLWIGGFSGLGTAAALTGLIVAVRTGSPHLLPILGLVGNLLIFAGMPWVMLWRHTVA